MSAGFYLVATAAACIILCIDCLRVVVSKHRCQLRGTSPTGQMISSDSISSRSWDHENGVWLDHRAAQPIDLPSPLYILGYGSLIWRPSDLLSTCQSFQCTALHWQRFFAQRSCDHRGTPLFPGLVLNLVDDSTMEEFGYRTKADRPSSLKGLLWLVPPTLAEAVVEDLDYRERGGYQRHLIDVVMDTASPHHSAGDTVRAIVYTGPRDNPMFCLPNLSVAGGIDSDHARRWAYSHALQIMSETIAAAVGPSGRNTDYLCNLESYLGRLEMRDPSLTELVRRVRLTLGPWRGRLLREQAAAMAMGGQLMRGDGAGGGDPTPGPLPKHLLGWGSNEFLQLSPLDPGRHRHAAEGVSAACLDSHNTDGEGERDNMPIVDAEYEYVVAGGATSCYVRHETARIWGKLVPEVLRRRRRRVDGGIDSLTTDDGPSSDDLRPTHAIAIEGVLGVSIGHDHMLLLVRTAGAEVVVGFGSNSHGQCGGMCVPADDVLLERVGGSSCSSSCSIDTFRVRIVESSILQKDGGVGSYGVSRIAKLAVGLRHSTAITDDGELLSWGDNSFGQLGDIETPQSAGPTTAAAVAAAAGAHLHRWRPPTGKVVDVACGVKYSVVIDDAGAVYFLGTDPTQPSSSSTLRRRTRQEQQQEQLTSRHARRVGGLPQGVRWRKVVSGWSHVVLKGVLPAPLVEGGCCDELVYVAWGKQHLHQFSSRQAALSAAASDDEPPQVDSEVMVFFNSQLLAPIPSSEGATAASIPMDVWCGSEYTVAVDAGGGLWSCGWNEHGNLGIGVVEGSPSGEVRRTESSSWRPVIHENSSILMRNTAVRGFPYPTDDTAAPAVDDIVDPMISFVLMRHIWEGSLACGGGHVICLS